MLNNLSRRKSLTREFLINIKEIMDSVYLPCKQIAPKRYKNESGKEEKLNLLFFV